ncbi:MAG TPA: hypothetical protein VFD70_05665 [Anaerolineae bacterium]|nr:hypothetical protein [Anaerolineae bacterium]
MKFILRWLFGLLEVLAECGQELETTESMGVMRAKLMEEYDRPKN